MKEIAAGFDTSNYTTSVAAFGCGAAENRSRLLDVPEGALGLRQSDALFLHVKRVPELAEELFSGLGEYRIRAVGASTRPVAREGSYMPCFLAGEGHGRALAAALGVPFYVYSHQQGHVAAALWSAKREDMMSAPFLAWHLSGGTTELLYVRPEGKSFDAEKIGGTEDLAAGQLIDRTGKLLKLQFPSGKALDALSRGADRESFFTARSKELYFSLSGLENKVNELYKACERPENIAYFAIRSVCASIERATKAAKKIYGDIPLLCSGGVASNTLIREMMTSAFGAVFALPRYSTDNAMGIAVLANGEL